MEVQKRGSELHISRSEDLLTLSSLLSKNTITTSNGQKNNSLDY